MGTKKATLNIRSLSTVRPGDRLEVRDGENKNVLTVFSGKLQDPVMITSGSNQLDVLFVSDGDKNVADGFVANYGSSSMLSLHIITLQICLCQNILFWTLGLPERGPM